MTDLRALWRIWRDAEDVALRGINADTLEEVDAYLASVRILAVRDWLFPGGEPPGPRAVAEHAIWWRLTEEARQTATRCNNCTGACADCAHNVAISGEAQRPADQLFP